MEDLDGEQIALMDGLDDWCTGAPKSSAYVYVLLNAEGVVPIE